MVPVHKYNSRYGTQVISRSRLKIYSDPPNKNPMSGSQLQPAFAPLLEKQQSENMESCNCSGPLRELALKRTGTVQKNKVTGTKDIRNVEDPES